jgi:hypothetical protein
MRAPRYLCCALLVAGGTAWPASDSWAYEHQWRVGGSFGYSLMNFGDEASHGFGGGAHLTYGVSDAFNLRIHSDVTAFDLTDPGDWALIWNSGAGFEYVVDILQWVPYLGVTIGPVDVIDLQDSSHQLHFGLTIPVGLGYQFTRDFTLGGEFSYRMLFGAEGDPLYAMTVMARAEYVWGY